MTLQGEPVTKKLRVSRNLTFLFKIFVQTGRKKMPKDLKDWSGPEMANLLREDLEERGEAIEEHRDRDELREGKRARRREQRLG